MASRYLPIEGMFSVVPKSSLKIEYQHTFYFPSVVRENEPRERTHEQSCLQDSDDATALRTEGHDRQRY